MLDMHGWSREMVALICPQLIKRWIQGRQTAARWREDTDFVNKMLQSFERRPTKPELALKDMLEQYFPGQFKYVGDGQRWKTIRDESGRVYHLNPDFIATDDRKLVIEMFGDYWHSKETQEKYGTMSEEKRRQLFASQDYKMLVIWEHEMKEPHNVVQKIQSFVN